MIALLLLLASSPPATAAPAAPAPPPSTTTTAPAASTSAPATASSAAAPPATSATGSTDVRFLTSVIATEIGKSPGLDVLSAEDVRQAVALDSERRATGCDEKSCLGEIAAAMGAQFAVYGSVEVLDDVYLVSLTAFDARSGSSAGRRTARASTRKELADVTAAAAHELGASIAPPASGKLRVLVLDLVSHGAVTAPAAAGFAWATVGAFAAGGVGVLALAGGALADYESVDLDKSTTADKSIDVTSARQRYGTSDTYATLAAVGYIAGAVCVVGGIALGVVGASSGGAE